MLPSVTPPTAVEFDDSTVPEQAALSPAACVTDQITDAVSPGDTAGTRDLSAAITASIPKPDDVAIQDAANIGPSSPAAKQPLTPQAQVTSNSADEPEPQLHPASAERLLAERAVIDQAAADGDAGAMALMATLQHTGRLL